jgi:twitching motility two-component system response regulator PilG
MLSGKTSPLDEVKGVLAGASTYLTKPVKHQQFQEVTLRITRWLDDYR